MIRLLIRLSLILLVVNHLLPPCCAYGSYKTYSRGYAKQNRDYEDPAMINTLLGSSAGVPSQGKLHRGLGISAWGIVVLIVAMILAVMGIYYFSICYPTICRKNTKYNLMGAPTLA